MIIGLSGYARAGKSEAANALREDGWEVRAFADKLREFLYTMNPAVWPVYKEAFHAHYGPSTVQKVIDMYGWDGYKTTPYNDEIRRLIQTLGTDCGRNLLGEDVWVNATLESYDNIGKFNFITWKRHEGADWVIQDVRFPNEAEAIKNRGGKIIRINKPGVEPVNGHESEIALDDWHFDGIIQNDEDIDKLHESIRWTVDVVTTKGI